MSLILPRSTVALIESVTDACRHPGLQLDKFSVPGDQEAQKAALDRVCKVSDESSLLNTLLLNTLKTRRKGTLGNPPETMEFSCTTSSPLSLHLSRASALENAGICLHPL
ncbi:MAG: hypothetical protein AAB300_04105, partial [Nitrospirota bacterium]